MTDMYGGNPLYNMYPVAPPGLEGLRQTVGGIVGGIAGMQQMPYVAPNQGTFDAMVASGVNNPLYKSMLSGVYAQMGRQIGNTVGGLRAIQGMGSIAGYSPAEVQKALSGGGAALGRSQIGQFIMPIVDQGLSAAGISGGSILEAASTAFAGRANLMGPGTLFNPLDAGQQHQMMGAASAMTSLMNGLMSQTDEKGNITAMTNSAFTQGFDRQRVMQLAMRAAGRGMFDAAASGGFEGADMIGAGGFEKRLSDLTGGTDLSALDFTAGDFSGGGKDSNLGKKAAKKVKAFTKEFAHRMQGITEAMGAIRDLTNEVDGLEDTLDQLTNGDWMRSGAGAYAARNSVRELQAVTQLYNLDPKQAIGQLMGNKTTMQQAAGFDARMRSLGFDGGGMFGLGAQTDFLASVEDMISARGLRNDPVAANRLRTQSLQVMSQNINTQAGRGAQVLAYARQTGILSNEEANRIRGMLTSGDRGVMDSGLNDLLVTVFGSAEAGRKAMNDQRQMTAIRQAMNDEAGKYAMRMTMQGAHAEFTSQERVTAADRRHAFSQQVLADSGLNTWQTEDGAGRTAESIAMAIREANPGKQGEAHSAAFLAQVDRFVAGGASRASAVSMAMDAFKGSKATAQYAEVMDLAYKNQATENNEAILKSGGLESRQANAMALDMMSKGMFKGNEGADVFNLIREGKGSEALAAVEGIAKKNLSKDEYQTLMDVKQMAKDDHDKAMAKIADDKETAKQLEDAMESGYGADAASKAYEELANAAKKYLGTVAVGEDSPENDNAYDDFMERVSKSKYAAMFGDKAFNDYLSSVNKAAKSGKKEDVQFIEDMGRKALSFKQLASDNLGANGYDAGVSGLFGGGLFAANSPKRRERMNDFVRDFAQKLTVSALDDADTRNNLAQDVLGFLGGAPDKAGLMRMLKLYDKEGDFTSGLAGYVDAFGDIESAKRAEQDADKAYKAAWKRINKGGNTLGASWIKSELENGGFEGFSDEEIRKRIKDEGGIKDEKDIDAIAAKAIAQKNVAAAQKKAQDALNKAGDDKKFRRNFESVQAMKKRIDAYNERIATDSDALSVINSLDLDDEDMHRGGLSLLKSKGGKLMNKVWDAVSDDEIQAKIGEDRMGDQHAKAQAALSIVQEKAKDATAKGHDTAVEAMKAFKAAASQDATRIRGELTIKNGNESGTCVLEGSAMGGGLSGQ